MDRPTPTPGDPSNRSILTVIVVLLAVIAACAVIGAGVWVYSWWKAQSAIGALAGQPDFTGTWVRSANDSDDRDARLIITNDNPIRGTIRVTFESDSKTCEAKWTESTREFGSVYVDAVVTSGDCFDNEWKVSVAGNTLTAVQAWSESGESAPTLVLHRK